jgi:D-methionine transport system substrate-binding protein
MVVVTAGCGSQQAAPAVGKGTGSDKPIKVGVTAGPHAEIMEVVKESR